MKTTFSVLLGIALTFSSCIGRVFVDRTGDFKLSKENYSFIQEYETPDHLQLNLETVGGNIDVSGYEGNRVNVAFVVTKNDGQVVQMTLEELQKYASFVITKEGNDLTIQIKEIFTRNMSVGFVVKAPIHTTCNLATSGGNVSLSGLVGNQQMATSGGNLFAEKVQGSLQAETSGGNIHIASIQGKSTISTSGGNIDVASVEGDLEANTSGGNIHLANHKGSANVSTSGGNIQLENLAGAVSASTSGGNVHARLLRLEKQLFLETNGGFIDCELPTGLGMDLDLSGSDIQTNLNNFQGSSSSEHIDGKMNGGGIPVRINCPGGSIHLKFNASASN